MAKKEPIEINKTGHIVVLDQSWHELFKDKKPMKLSVLENKLNKLLKEQGKVNNDYKGYQVLKKQMMEEIVKNMDAALNQQNSSADIKMKSNSRHINEINKKFEQLEKRKEVLPHEIEEVNRKLLTESLAICYERMVKNKNGKAKLEKDIDELHERVKTMVGQKEDMEAEITALYQYMHDIAGIDIIEQYDRMYFGED